MKQAFSLVELSIVLVILGLLTGGILTGQNLIRAAELRSITTEFKNYQSAVYTFRDKYFALPGDMTNATDFWGAVGNGGTGTCGYSSTAANIGTGTETCNGNGDGFLGTRTQPGEAFRFWQQLANAGLLEGSFAGVGDDSSGDGLLADPSGLNGLNQLPTSKADSSAFWAIWAEAGHSSTFYSSTNKYLYKNAFMLDTDPVSARGIGHGVSGAISPEEMWNIDTKIDDGLPAQGKLHAGYGGTVGTTAC